MNCYVRKKPITERRDMSLHDVPLSMSWLGFEMGTMLLTSISVVLCCC